ncbi:carbohydrate-binding module 1 protein [Pleurotus pulmonarius]|nr:carbohydrate-binding module 1 protein [Pleurotus pulmonarius]
MYYQWKDDSVKGGKAKQQDKEEKRKADLARKAENARLLAEEETAVAAAKKAAPKATKKSTKDVKPAGPGAIAAGGGLVAPEKDAAPPEEVESYAATGIDNALDLLEVVTAKTDKASVGQQAASIERHPERRFKAAFEAYQEREMPNVRKEHPGLRLQQYKELLFKQFQKSPENPFNQATISYDASKEEKVDALKTKHAQTADRLLKKAHFCWTSSLSPLTMTCVAISSSSPSSSRPSSPKNDKTNTLAITSLPKSFFSPNVLDALRRHFVSFGSINQWVPLPGFGRIIVVFEVDDHAETAKLQSDPIIIESSLDQYVIHRSPFRVLLTIRWYRSHTTLRVYRADPNPLISQDTLGFVPEANYLRPPPIEKNFLISPPGSPPVGWEQIREDPPNATPLAEDLIAALQKLQTGRKRSSIEILLDPQEGSGVGVYVQDCDGEDDDEAQTREEDWIYGESAPARQKWMPVHTALPPMRAVSV